MAAEAAGSIEARMLGASLADADSARSAKGEAVQLLAARPPAEGREEREMGMPRPPHPTPGEQEKADRG